jgi:hypothetical protein
MDLQTADILVKIVAGSVTAATAVFGVLKGLSEWRKATQQRRDELALRQREFRHKQAIFGRELAKEVFADPKSRDALRMLDWLDTSYHDDSDNVLRIRRADVQNAMRTVNLTFTDEEVFIRTRFESLYDHFEQMEHLISLNVIDFTDVETAFRYYVHRAMQPDIQHLGFLDMYDYPQAKAFLQRFRKKQ